MLIRWFFIIAALGAFAGSAIAQEDILAKLCPRRGAC